MGESHIGNEWESTKESRKKDETIAIVAIQMPSSTPRVTQLMTTTPLITFVLCQR
jgi:uncharacterized protein with ACT and thioredoxin-like domain